MPSGEASTVWLAALYVGSARALTAFANFIFNGVAFVESVPVSFGMVNE